MPRLIDGAPLGPPLDPAGAIAALEAIAFDPREPGAWDAAAPILARLSANRDFLARIAADRILGRAGHEDAIRYGPQVVMLGRGRGGWFLRANLWPTADDALLRASGRRAFFYDLPHNHNFAFLTIGHHGPGYESDYWTFDPAGVRGLPGEAVSLRFAGRQRLGPGRIMLYAAHSDVHDQQPPAAFSVSLNIVEGAGIEPWRDQYRFDPVRGRIVETLNATAIEGLLPLAAHLGGDEGRELLDEVASRHPVDRIRFGAVRALAGAAPDAAGWRAVLDRAAGSPDRYVATRARASLPGGKAAANQP